MNTQETQENLGRQLREQLARETIMGIGDQEIKARNKQNTSGSAVALAGSIAAVVAGLITKNEEISPYMVSVGLPTALVSGFMVYEGFKRYLTLEKQL